MYGVVLGPSRPSLSPLRQLFVSAISLSRPTPRRPSHRLSPAHQYARLSLADFVRQRPDHPRGAPVLSCFASRSSQLEEAPSRETPPPARRGGSSFATPAGRIARRVSLTLLRQR